MYKCMYVCMYVCVCVCVHFQFVICEPHKESVLTYAAARGDVQLLQYVNSRETYISDLLSYKACRIL